VRDPVFKLCPVWLDQAGQPSFPGEAHFWAMLECLGADLSVDLTEGIARQPVHLDIVLDSEFQRNRCARDGFAAVADHDLSCAQPDVDHADGGIVELLADCVVLDCPVIERADGLWKCQWAVDVEGDLLVWLVRASDFDGVSPFEPMDDRLEVIPPCAQGQADGAQQVKFFIFILNNFTLAQVGEEGDVENGAHGGIVAEAVGADVFEGEGTFISIFADAKG